VVPADSLDVGYHRQEIWQAKHVVASFGVLLVYTPLFFVVFRSSSEVNTKETAGVLELNPLQFIWYFSVGKSGSYRFSSD
jgi:hypothetical protein